MTVKNRVGAAAHLESLRLNKNTSCPHFHIVRNAKTAPDFKCQDCGALVPKEHEAKAVRIEDEAPAQPTGGKLVCQFACEHECTLVGHVQDAVHFLNECLENGIVKSAVEGDPEYQDMWFEIGKMMGLLKTRERK